MNIFFLDSDPKLCAQFHNNRHVVKMILESTQLLCSYFKNSELEPPYRITHYNHPCSKWVRHSPFNYLWLLNLAYALSDEYTFRYGKIHASHKVILWLDNNKPKIYLPLENQFAPPPQCMPDKYKQNNTIQAYRDYYMGEKASFCQWKNRPIPYWFQKETEISS